MTWYVPLTLQHWCCKEKQTLDCKHVVELQETPKSWLIQHSHFQDANEGSQRVRNMPNVTQQVKAVLGLPARFPLSDLVQHMH